MVKNCAVNNYEPQNSISDYIKIDNFGIENNLKKSLWGPGQRTFHILHFVTWGKGYFNGKEVRKGQGFLISPNMLHEYHFDPKNPWKYFWVILTGKAVEKIISSLDIDENNIFNIKNEEKINKIYENIKLFSENGETIDFATALELFFGLISSCSLVLPKTPSTPAERITELAKNYIKSNLHRSISVKDVANYVSVSPNYLTNLFLRLNEKSPKNYITQLRLETACNLLKTDNILIKEIAISVGYSDSLQFSRFFKKHIGLSPSEYREKKVY